jgi:predicted naringenin-chalcone synthase
LAKIISIATAVPQYKHNQLDILQFMKTVFNQSDDENRKLQFLYKTAGIQNRYSVINDYGKPLNEWTFFSASEEKDNFPSVEKRMQVYSESAATLCVTAINDCIQNKIIATEITHLITVSCTGMSAPGLDLQITELMGLPKNINRTSINFMGCYAAIHALKMADGILATDATANVVIVCVEFCTLHFQKEYTIDNITASLLFGDGCAAILLQNNSSNFKGLVLQNFYSEIALKGKKDMAWELSSTGFLMTLSSYVSNLIEEDFEQLLTNALKNAQLNKNDITHWCIHPGGKKIVQAVEKSIQLQKSDLQYAYDVLNDYGNMSSPTILFVLKKQLDELMATDTKATLFGAAFGPGITMETFIATYA